MNWREYCGLSLVFAALTALGIWIFPGHTFLVADTQIYIPLFEHLRDTRLMNRELILQGAHLSYTIYDEVTLGLSSALQLDFEKVLIGQQCFFRWLGFWGAYLLARACGMSMGAGVLTSTLLWLGAFVFGPAVITTEYEPVPRGFAVPLVVAGLGCLARGWRWVAALCVALAFLYHAPALWPVLLVALYLRDWRMLGAVGAAGVLLAALAGQQRGVVEAQPFFSLLSPDQRAIQQMRASYNWITLWPWRWWAQYLVTGGLAIAAFWRVRSVLPISVQPYFRWMPVIGLATMPVSWILLEQFGWALLPQVQPMRALLYCHLFCQLLGAIAAWLELREGKWWKAFAWMAVPLSLAMRGDLLLVPAGELWKQGTLLAALLFGIWIASRWPRREWAWAASFTLAIFLGEGLQARGYRSLDTKPVEQLAGWAKEKTPLDAIFLFGDLGRRIEPGIFRARAARAVYVCWKQGGQVNYFPRYSTIWLERWSKLIAPNAPPLDLEDLRRRGITYLVLTKTVPKEKLEVVFESASYRVYRLL